MYSCTIRNSTADLAILLSRSVIYGGISTVTLNLHLKIHIFAAKCLKFFVNRFGSGNRCQIIHRNISIHSMVFTVCPFFIVCAIFFPLNMNRSSIDDQIIIQYITLRVSFRINVYTTVCTLHCHIVICNVIWILLSAIIRINTDSCQDKAQQHRCYCSQLFLHNLIPSLFVIFFL